MGTPIQHLHIKNFKSVRDLRLECDRINVFIGQPNAGKTNVLEAISLLGASSGMQHGPEGKFLESFIRYKSLIHLFGNFNARAPIEVLANDGTMARIIAEKDSNVNADFKFSITAQSQVDLMQQIVFRVQEVEFRILANGNIMGSSSHNLQHQISAVKKYDFRGLRETNTNGLFLAPPFGDNFYSIVESTPRLREEIQEFLKPNGLEFLLDVEAQRMAVVQKTEDTLLSFPLHLVPDTFQRYIFHLAAIMSNTNSVLLFEEPESHSYAPYVYQLAQHILNDEGGNQYFITTHSPYFLLPLMQEGKDVAVFATWFEDYQTHARRLSEEEIREMLDYGVDIFLNLDHLTTA